MQRGAKQTMRCSARRIASHHPPLPSIPAALSWEKFRTEGHALVDYIANHHASLEGSEPPALALNDMKPGFLMPRMQRFIESQDPSAMRSMQPAATFGEVVGEFEEKVRDGIVHWQHKGFFGFFPAQLSPSALLGEMLMLCYNQPCFAYSTSPSATELEWVVMNALAKAMQLPDIFMWPPHGTGGGCIQPSATEGVTLSLIAAKERALSRVRSQALHTAFDDAKHVDRLVVYFSDQTHFSVEKACKILGIKRIRKLPTVLNVTVGNYCLDMDVLESAIAEDLMHGLLPCCVIGNFGGTATCAVDPLQQIGSLCQRTGIWFHVDAAYAGAVALCPEFRPLLNGIETADSFSVNGSKWMNMSVNCSFLYFRNPAAISYGVTSGGNYVPRVEGSRDLKDFQLGMARPFLSLKVYAVLRTLGADGIASIIRRHVLLAQYLDSLLRADGDIEVEVKTVFGLVVFRFRMISNEDNKRVAQELMKEGDLFVGSALIAQKFCFRVSLSHSKLEYVDMDNFYKKLKAAYGRVAGSSNS